MTKRDIYLARFQQRREEAVRTEAQRTAEKPISQMSEAELEQEAERVRAEIRRTQEMMIEAGRQELHKPGPSQARRPFPRRTRRPWK